MTSGTDNSPRIARFGRCKDIPWDIPHTSGNGRVYAEWTAMQTAILLDIRDELKTLNAILNCADALREVRK